MTNEDITLLKLIRKSQFDLVDNLDFSNIDIDLLYDEAIKQSVLGIIAPEIPLEYSNEKIITSIYRQKSSYILYIHAQSELCDILNKKGIKHSILKGCASAIYYKDPTLRSMGDIDFIVNSDDYIITKNLLHNNGYIEIKDDGRHTSYKKDGFEFEVHKHFSLDNDIEDYVIEGLNNPVIAKIDGCEFYMLPQLANGVVLLDHIRRHLKYALGFRQVIDWMMFVNSYLDDSVWNNQFVNVAKEKGMETLAKTVTRMCQIYLGLSESITWCYDADESNCNLLMKCIMFSGNFGCKNGKGNKIELVSVSMQKIGLLRWLQQAGEHNWKYYHRYRWLRPFCWIYQIFRYIKQAFIAKRKSNEIVDDFVRSKDRYKLLKNMGIV